MSGLMISGRLKTIEKELSTKNEQILELNTASSTFKDQIQELTNLNYDNQNEEKLDNTKSHIDQTSVIKILSSIHEKLKSLVNKYGIDFEENKRNDSNEKQDVETDQPELF